MEMKPSQTETDSAILDIQDVVMRFGGVTALKGIRYRVPAGIIQAVIGPNGAGKTTLFHCVSGMLLPTSGSILFGGEPVQGLPPHQVARRGISRTFQHVALFQHMSVLENVLAGTHMRYRNFVWDAVARSRRFRREEREARELALALLEKTGLADNRQMAVDWTLVVHTEKAHGVIADIDPTLAVTA